MARARRPRSWIPPRSCCSCSRSTRSERRPARASTRSTKQLGVLEAQRAIAERTYRAHEASVRATGGNGAAARRGGARSSHARGPDRGDAVRSDKPRRARSSSSDARVAQIRDQIRKSRVLNPVAGTVLTTYAKAGEFVQIGQPLYKIANLDTMELRAYVTEPQLAHVKVGQPVQVSIDVGGEARRAHHRHDLVGVIAGRVHADADRDARRARESRLRDQGARAELRWNAQDRNAGRPPARHGHGVPMTAAPRASR